MSYLHLDEKEYDGSKDTKLTWNPAPLAHSPPWLVSYNNPKEEEEEEDTGLLGIVCYGYQPEPELLAEAINGTLVAIVHVQNVSKAFNISTLQDLVQQTPEQIPYIRPFGPLDPRYSHCLGLALIRGVDAESQHLALSTPLSAADQLNGKRIVLVSGKFDPPTWAYTEDHYYRAFRKGGEEEEEEEDVVEAGGFADEIPWTEKLHGSQKRAVGSKVWRVRRDLGRNNSGGD